jgi:hypothetical protein
MTPDNCPDCRTSLKGAEIPTQDREFYSGTHFNRVIGIEDPEIYDGVDKWRCPDCGYEWSAFPFSMEKK